MKTLVLTVPQKKTEDVNWTKVINNYLTQLYGASHEYGSDLEKFNTLRSNLKGAKADDTGINIYYNYYSQLELLDLKIPFDSLYKKPSFIWYDAFATDIKHKQHALPFEKANVLFNLAGIITRFAALKYRQDEEKELIKLLQQAAGILKFVAENFLHSPSNDLDPGTLQFLISLLLVQSQEIFLLKLVVDDVNQLKNSLIAKLCASAGEKYSECLGLLPSENAVYGDTADYEEDDEDELEGSQQETVRVPIDTSWRSIIEFKSIYYKSLGYYYNGLYLESSQKFGDAIAYLTRSHDILNLISSSLFKTISKSGDHEVYELLDNYKLHKDSLNIKLGELNKDNDLIYHDIVPSLVTLPEVKPLDSTKIIPMTEISKFNEINDYNYENFFKNVVPINIYELSSYYSEEKSQLLRNEIDLIDVSNEELSSVLEYLKLPQSLVHFKELLNNQSIEVTTGSVDAETLAKSREIHDNYNQNLADKQKILQLRQEIYSAVTKVEYNEAVKLKKSLYDATSNDDKLFGLINVELNELYTTIGKYGPTSTQFKQLFEIQTNHEEVSLLDMPIQENLGGSIKKLEDLLYDLNVIKANKSKLLENLKAEIHKDDISDILILNSKIKSTNEIKNYIFPEELKKFKPFEDELDKLISNQALFIKNLRDEWSTLSSSPKFRDINSSSQYKNTLIKDQVQKIGLLYDNWKKYNVGLKKGVQFYTQLLDYCNQVSMQSQFDQLDLKPQRGQQPQQAYQPPSHQSPAYQSPGFQPPGYQQPQSYQSQSHQSQSYQQPQYQPQQSYDRPPTLPPKRPSVTSRPSATSQPSPSQSNSNLIYDQPSTYNPNMYNFFSKD